MNKNGSDLLNAEMEIASLRKQLQEISSHQTSSSGKETCDGLDAAKDADLDTSLITRMNPYAAYIVHYENHTTA